MNNCTFTINIIMNPRLLIFITILLPGSLLAQTSYNFKIATDRMLFHDLVDKQQKAMLNEKDSLKLSPDDAVNLQVADVFIRQVDELQEKIESDTTLTGQVKVKSLKSLETLLKGYNRYRDKKDYPISMAPALFKAYMECLLLDRDGKSIEPVIEKNGYGVGKLLIECFLFPTENEGVKESRVLLTRKFLETHPDQILPELNKNPNIPFADHFIQV